MDFKVHKLFQKYEHYTVTPVEFSVLPLFQKLALDLVEKNKNFVSYIKSRPIK